MHSVAVGVPLRLARALAACSLLLVCCLHLSWLNLGWVLSNTQAEAPSNPGFTPLITLKRPGTVNATRTPSQPAAGAAAAAASGGGTSSAPASDSTVASPAAGSGITSDVAQHDGVIIGDDVKQQQPGKASPHNSGEAGGMAAVAEAATAEDVMSPAKTANGAVYGASYPPEMIEAMMQEYNAKNGGGVGGGGFWGGGGRLKADDRERDARSAASAPSTPSLSHPSTPSSDRGPRAGASAGVGGDAVAASADSAQNLEGAIIGTGQNDGRAEAAAAAAASPHGIAGSHREGVRSEARTSKDCRTIAKYEQVSCQLNV